MKAVVLGAAAGGGFPQWNSNAEACRRARAGDAEPSPRTQASLAVSGDGERWFLINASPDLRQQIEARAILHPRQGQRSSPIEGVILTGADVDAIAGLLHLRERQPFTLYASARVLAVLDANPIFGVLAPECVAPPGSVARPAVRARHLDGSPSGLEIELFDVPGKVALYLEGRPRRRRPGRPGRRHGGRGGARGRAAAALHPGLCAHDRRAEAAARRRVGRAVRRHAVARRRDDPARPRTQDGTAHGPYERQRPGRHGRGFPRHPGEARAS